MLHKAATDRRGAAAVEFAIVVGILVSVIFGALQLGLLLWTRNSLQLIASMTARCVAIDSCAANPTAYAQTLASSIAMGNILGDLPVTVDWPLSCGGASATNGGYTRVTISTSFWHNVLVGPIPGTTLTVSACYVTPASSQSA